MKKGFTLLEMIVVVMIVATLFMLTIPNVARVMDSVDNKACDALTKVVDEAVVMYKIEYQEYPHSIQDLVSAGFLDENQTTCKNGNSIYLSDNHATY